MARTHDAKRVVADGLAWAVAHGVTRSSAGLLMDTETGAEVLAVVKSWSIRRGSGRTWRARAVFEFEHGAAYREHIERDDADT